MKLGYVNQYRLLEEAPQAAEINDQLRKEFTSREEKITKGQETLSRMEEKLTRDSVIMSESERKKLSMDVLTKKRELRRLQDEFREDISIRKNDALGSFQKTISTAIQEVGEEGNFDIIFYEGISYTKPDYDVTDMILEKLQKMMKKK